MTAYETVIGLEIHAELNTASKLYCGCRNVFGAAPNTQVCPVCLGLPGALPVLNAAAVDYAIMMGHALGCRIHSLSRQDRKHYFYPDLPKAYQISQAQVPLCEEGCLHFLTEGKETAVRIQRIHIEEDAGKLLHEDSGGTLADYNRCGVPLIEIVTHPDLRSSAEAKACLETVKSILLYLGISDCKMQEGSIRCDVNVSLREAGSTAFGTRCEMKNINSFSAAVRGIEYERKRQTAILEAGGIIEQETRRWDDGKGMSIPMRSKEDAEDYRFFPEPDLPVISVPEERIAALKAALPELPNEKIVRYVHSFGLKPEDAVLLMESPDKCRLFDECTALELCPPGEICKWILGDVSKFMNETGRSIPETPITAHRLCRLIACVQNGEISNSAGKRVFQEMLHRDAEPEMLIAELGLVQNSDADALRLLAQEIIAANPQSAADYRRGKTRALGYLVGQCMKASGGRANPGILREIVTEILQET